MMILCYIKNYAEQYCGCPHFLFPVLSLKLSDKKPVP